MKCINKPIILVTVLLLSLGGICCNGGEGEPDPGWSKDPADALDPSGRTALKGLPIPEVNRAVGAASKSIDMARPRGIEAMISALKEHLRRNGIELAALDKINDDYIGAPLIKMSGSNESDASLPDGVGQQKMALSIDNFSAYYYCPLEAPEQNSNTSCKQLVESVVLGVKSQIQSGQDKVESAIGEEFPDLSPTAREFVVAWAIEAELYGAEVAAIYARNELMAAAQCDDKSNANEIAFHLGVEQGRDLVTKRKDWAIRAIESNCVLNTDYIASLVRIQAHSEIGAFMKENPICKDQDLSQLNQALLEADKHRLEGIKIGIEEQAQILKIELRRARWDTECPSEEICDDVKNLTTGEDFDEPDFQVETKGEYIGHSCVVIDEKADETSYNARDRDELALVAGDDGIVGVKHQDQDVHVCEVRLDDKSESDLKNALNLLIDVLGEYDFRVPYSDTPSTGKPEYRNLIYNKSHLEDLKGLLVYLCSEEFDHARIFRLVEESGKDFLQEALSLKDMLNGGWINDFASSFVTPEPIKLEIPVYRRVAEYDDGEWWMIADVKVCCREKERGDYRCVSDDWYHHKIGVVDEPRYFDDGTRGSSRNYDDDKYRAYYRYTGLERPVWCWRTQVSPTPCFKCNRDYLHVGSPLVIDLDGDGLELSPGPVRFDLLADGSPPQITWVGPREALLALDLDGDGRIGSSIELFGNKSDCNSEACTDGVEALRIWDDPSRGGNSDGIIDARDRIYPRLQLWMDENGDGESQPVELSSLKDRGIQSISLDASYAVEKLPSAVVTSRMDVVTLDGVRQAHDVWFYMKVTTENLPAMAPIR